MLLGSDRVAWIIENSVDGLPEVILCELSEWNADSPANTLSLSSIGRLVPSNRNDNLNQNRIAVFLSTIIFCIATYSWLLVAEGFL